MYQRRCCATGWRKPKSKLRAAKMGYRVRGRYERRENKHEQAKALHEGSESRVKVGIAVGEMRMR